MAAQSIFSSCFVKPFVGISKRRAWPFRVAIALLMMVPGLQCFGTTAVAAGDSDAGLSTSRRADRKQAEHQTRALAGLMARYRRADAAGKAALQDELVERARDRQALLGELVQTDPGGALRAVLPEKVRFGMPDAVREFLTQKATLQGELTVAYEDYPDGRHRLRHILETETGRFELQWVRHAGHLQSGTPVRARGRLFAHGGETMGTLVLDDAPDSLALLADDADAATTTATAEVAVLPNTLGEQRILVLLVNFQDNPVQPWTLEQARETVFGTVNDFYQENSNGQTWLSGDVHGYYTLPITATCDAWEIHVNAQQAAEAQGIDVGAYNRMVYIFPGISSCGWTGMGTLGGTVSLAWINGSLTLRTVGHELGHNFGLHHAEQLECGTEIMGDNCISITYGDNLDIMGESGVTGHFNTFNKELLGWLTPASGEVVTAEGDGSYLLEPYETAPAGAAKGLKVLRGIDAATGQKLWYYLEYRQALGFDGFLDDKPGITGGVVLRLATASDIESSQLLDMTPASTRYDLDDAALLAGRSYSDPDAGVTITTAWADAAGAGVGISFSGPSCIPANPSLSLSPAESAWMPAGSTVTYAATLTNQDSSGCPSSDFSVALTLPPGWGADSPGLNLAPGASGTVNISVTSADSAVDGFYDIPVSAINNGDMNYQSSATVTYVVDTPAPVCVPANPLLAVSAVDGEPVAAGTPVTYAATLTNQGTSGCEPAVFEVTANVPTGWTASSASVSLAPGESTTVDVSVRSALDAADGIHEMSIHAENSADAGYYATAAVTYRVAAPPNSAPLAVDDTVSLTVKDAISIDVLANDTDPDGDPLRIIQVTQGTQGSVRITSDGSLLYTADKSFKGSDSFTYTISDGEKTAGATVDVSLVKKR